MPTWCRHVHVRPHCFILTEECSYILELAFLEGKISKNRLVCKNAVALAYYESCRLPVMGSWPNQFHQAHLSIMVWKTFPHGPRSFWLALRITTSGRVRFFEQAETIRFVLSANQICQTDSEHAQSDRKSVTRRSFPQVRDSCCWPKGARPLGTRMGRASNPDPLYRWGIQRMQRWSLLDHRTPTAIYYNHLLTSFLYSALVKISNKLRL